MESIFEDGYLKQEFINPNYRGFPGWDCELWCGIRGNIIKDKLLLNSYNGMVLEEHNININNTVKIPQFTLEKIPVDEIVWIKPRNGDLICWYKCFMKDIYRCSANKSYIVPHLFAETEEDAERLKDWADL